MSGLRDVPFPEPHRDVIRSSMLRPVPESAKEAHAAAWLAFHIANPWVYAAFCKLAEQMRVDRKRPYYSVEIIINVLRWHHDLATQDGDFKINNNYKSFYARAYEHHYDCDQFFRKRESFADALVFPDAHSGILRGRLPDPS